MVISIDAVRYGAELGPTEYWQTEISDYVFNEEPRRGSEVLAPARGMMCGLLLSGALWVGLLVAARAVLTAIR